MRLAGLLHDLGKPLDGGRRRDHARSAPRSPTRSWRGSATRPACSTASSGSSPHHAFELDGPIDALDARRFLAEHGDELAFDLIAHKAPTWTRSPCRPPSTSARGARDGSSTQERSQPHRLSDLAVTGDDLLAIGFGEGPELGRVLHELLDAVVDDPARNDRDWLLERARRELA